jgi:hypothetical protein
MSGTQKRTLRERLHRLGWFAQAGLVAGVVLVAWFVLAPLAFAISGYAGMIAAAVGGLVCLAGAELALALASLFRGPAAAMYALAVGMLARTIVPMLLGVALHLSVPRLAAAGMIFYLLIFYVVALATETVLLVAKIPPATASPGKAV